jgi:hypothetical protein
MNMIFEKTKKVIESCTTIQQLKGANRYVELIKIIDEETFEKCKEILKNKETNHAAC